MAAGEKSSGYAAYDAEINVSFDYQHTERSESTRRPVHWALDRANR
jgi:hypothetical protein